MHQICHISQLSGTDEQSLQRGQNADAQHGSSIENINPPVKAHIYSVSRWKIPTWPPFTHIFTFRFQNCEPPGDF